MHINDLPTPAVVIDIAALRKNIATMADVHPGKRLRPHIKAHKCSGLAAEQEGAGHSSFTCATPREVLGMIHAGVGNDFLLANEVLDPRRLEALASAQDQALITLAIDSEETLDAAERAGIQNIMIDVNVGLPRCGCDPSIAGRLADSARVRGMTVRGVMGYEGHLMMVNDREEKKKNVRDAMSILALAHEDVRQRPPGPPACQRLSAARTPAENVASRQAYYEYVGMTPPPPETKTGVRLIKVAMSSKSKKSGSTNPTMKLTLVMPRIYLCPTPDLPLDGDYSVLTV